VVDEVVIALPMESSYGQAARIAALCEEQGIIVRLLSDIFNLRLAQSRAEEFAGEAVTTLSAGAPDGWQHLSSAPWTSRCRSLAMLLLSPLFLLAALIVKLTSPGPASSFRSASASTSAGSACTSSAPWWRMRPSGNGRSST
jgi:hypothetical protein